MRAAAAVPPIASIASTYRDVVVDRGHQPALLLLVAFGITFGVTRFVTHSIRARRFSWLGDVEAGDTHIHHLVWGIVLLLVSGLLAIVARVPLEISAVLFGVGAALTLDEFALWLHLDDVYWSEQGRQSIDAVIVFAIVTGFMLLGAYPLSIGESGSARDVASVAATIVFGAMWAVVGVYVGPVAVIGALRLAKPDSWWARKRYDAAKLARSRARYEGEAAVHRPELR